LPQQILWNKFYISCAYFTPNCTWSPELFSSCSLSLSVKNRQNAQNCLNSEFKARTRWNIPWNWSGEFYEAINFRKS
jgi:hypothetical protein